MSETETRTDCIEITEAAPSGAGLGFADGRPVLVPDALPGEVRRVRWRAPAPGGRFGLALESELVRPSPDADEDRCPLAGRCGGCPLGRLAYEAETALKRRILVETPLKEAGLFFEGLVGPVAAQPEAHREGFRNKAILRPLKDAEGQLRFGFFESRSHTPVAAEDCPQAPLLMREAAHCSSEALEGLPLYDETTGTGLLRALLMRKGTAADALLAVLVAAREPDEHEGEVVRRWAASLPEGSSAVLHVNARPGNAVLDYAPGASRILTGAGSVEVLLEGLSYDVRPETFLQVNTPQTPVLYGRALELAAPGPEDVLLDLYCGIGTMTLLAASMAKSVIGVELIDASVAAARDAARKNGISNARFEAGPVERVLPTIKEPATVAILDPAYKGLDAAVPKALAAIGTLERIVYVSCNPKSFARDAKRLEAEGFKLLSVDPVDLFPGAMHLETIAFFTRGKAAR